jgi:copper chaperone
MKMNLTFQVEGMSCNHCKMAVTNALKELDGVEKVEVSLEKGTV